MNKVLAPGSNKVQAPGSKVLVVLRLTVNIVMKLQLYKDLEFLLCREALKKCNLYSLE